MFDRKNDICLKFVNGILLIITVISLGLAIGNNYYDSNSLMNCEYSRNYLEKEITTDDYKKQAQADYNMNCRYARSVSEDNSKKMMYVGYSLSATSVTGLIIANLLKKRDK